MFFHPGEGTETVGVLKARVIAASPDGLWVAAGGDDHVVRVYDVHTGRQHWAFRCHGRVTGVVFSPDVSTPALYTAAGNVLYVFVPPAVFPATAVARTLAMLKGGLAPLDDDGAAGDDDGAPAPGGAADDDEDDDLPAVDEEREPGTRLHLVSWVGPPTRRHALAGLALRIVHHAPISHVAVHAGGDYVATVTPGDPLKKRIVLLLHMSRRRALNPFPGLAKFRDRVTSVAFFRGRGDAPGDRLVVCLHRTVRIFSLVSGRLQTKLKGPINRLTSCSVHAGGQHILASSADGDGVLWDLDHGAQPHRRFSTHKKPVRCAVFHPRPHIYPLFATCSDDGTIHVFHAKPSEELMVDMRIVPLKVLKGHSVVGHEGVMDLVWHPRLPWLLSAGVDGTVRVWTE